MPSWWYQLRTPLVALLALCAAIAVVAVIGYFTVGGNSFQSAHDAQVEQQKLNILANLHSTSSASISQKEKTLNTLSPAPSSTPSEDEKLKILNALKAQR